MFYPSISDPILYPNPRRAYKSFPPVNGLIGYNAMIACSVVDLSDHGRDLWAIPGYAKENTSNLPLYSFPPFSNCLIP